MEILVVGKGAITTHGDMMVTSSADAYVELYSKVIYAAMAGNLSIDFVDSDI